MTEESFADWIEKHADNVVDEVLKTAADTKNTEGEYRLYNKDGAFINTYSNKEIAIHVAKKKGYTIRHVKKTVKQPAETKT